MTGTKRGTWSSVELAHDAEGRLLVFPLSGLGRTAYRVEASDETRVRRELAWASWIEGAVLVAFGIGLAQIGPPLLVWLAALGIALALARVAIERWLVRGLTPVRLAEQRLVAPASPSQARLVVLLGFGALLAAVSLGLVIQGERWLGGICLLFAALAMAAPAGELWRRRARSS